MRVDHEGCGSRRVAHEVADQLGQHDLGVENGVAAVTAAFEFGDQQPGERCAFDAFAHVDGMARKRDAGIVCAQDRDVVARSFEQNAIANARRQIAAGKNVRIAQREFETPEAFLDVVRRFDQPVGEENERRPRLDGERRARRFIVFA